MFTLFSLDSIKMNEKALIFVKQCINKSAFLKHKYLIDIDKVVISSKNSYGKKGIFKYFIEYITNYIKSLYIKLHKMNGYVKYFDSNNKYMIFLVHDEELLKKTNEIWDKISNLLQKRFDTEPV